MANIILTEATVPFKTGCTQYVKKLNAKIHFYMDCCIITDLTNAEKKGEVCKQIVIDSITANYQVPIADDIYQAFHRYYQTLSISLAEYNMDNFIKDIMDQKNVVLKFLKEREFVIEIRYLVQGSAVVNPFKKLSKEVQLWFEEFKPIYENLMEMVNTVSLKTHDGGTCNEDDVLLNLAALGFKSKEIKRACIIYGIPLEEMERNKLYKGWYRSGLSYRGQAYKRECSAKAIHSYLKEKNYDVMLWHQIAD